MQMETISRHAVKYRTEKYFKNKLIKNFTYFDLGKVNLNAAPNGHQTSSFISIFLSIITRKSSDLKKVPQKPCFKICRGGGGGGVCRGQGSHCKFKVFSIFIMGPRSSREL